MQNKKENDKKRNRAPLDIQTLVYGKVPPQAKDIERQLLGIIMVVAQWNQDALINVITEVRRLFKAIGFLCNCPSKNICCYNFS